jgi:hypothetical protein
MGKKRQLQRAQAQHARQPGSHSRRDLRRQTAVERFSKDGAEKLWLSLLAYDDERQGRVWLAQAVNDGARAKERDPGSFDAGFVVSAFEGHVARGAGKLTREVAENAVEIWSSSGDDYTPNEPAAKWHYLANLSEKVGLGTVTPEALQDDWEAWTSLQLASGPRATLMASLAQTEQAAVLLHGVTKSEAVGALVNVSRAMWSALAYGDTATFERIQRFSTEWLATLGKR